MKLEEIYILVKTTGTRSTELPPFFYFLFTYNVFIFNQTSLLFHLFFLNLTCLCPHSYNLMLTTTYVCRPYIRLQYCIIHVKKGGNSVSWAPVVKTTYLLRSLNLEHPKSKCTSSSTKLSEQCLQSLPRIGVFCMVFLPISIWSLWLLTVADSRGGFEVFMNVLSKYQLIRYYLKPLYKHV